MSIKIEVKTSPVQERSGEKNGKAWSIRTQTGWAYMFDQEGKPLDYPIKIQMQLEKNQQPYAAGNYTISPLSFLVGDFDKLSIGRLTLIPATTRAAAA